VTGLPRSQQDERYLVAITFAGLISYAITIKPTHDSDIPSARRRYFDWLFDRILRKRLEAEPGLVATIADLLKRALLDTDRAEIPKHIPETVVTWLLQEFYEDLPQPIRDELKRDTDFMASIGLRSAITIDGLHFDPDDFWRAASEAVNDRQAAICPLELDREIILECVVDHGQYVLRFDHPTTNKKGIVQGDEVRLLRLSRSNVRSSRRGDCFS
jgi:hypothetical protein